MAYQRRHKLNLRGQVYALASRKGLEFLAPTCLSVSYCHRRYLIILLFVVRLFNAGFDRPSPWGGRITWPARGLVGQERRVYFAV